MNDLNRFLIALAAGIWIVGMAVAILLTWAAPDDTIGRLGDFVEFLSDNNTSAGKLIVTMAAAAAAILGLLIVILEFAPEDEIKELRVEQAGATTIIPADALRMRLEEALLTLPGVTAARTRVWTRDRGVAASVELIVPPNTNVAAVTQEAVRVVVDSVQTDLGLPVSGVPTVKVAFGGKTTPPAEPAAQPTQATPLEAESQSRTLDLPATPAEAEPAGTYPEPLAHDGPPHQPPRSLDVPLDDGS